MNEKPLEQNGVDTVHDGLDVWAEEETHKMFLDDSSESLESIVAILRVGDFRMPAAVLRSETTDGILAGGILGVRGKVHTMW